MTGHPLHRVPAVDPTPGAENLDGKDGLSQEHPPREMWNWRAQRLSWEPSWGGTLGESPLERGRDILSLRVMGGVPRERLRQDQESS